jgi:hypothetical protein
MRLTPRYTPRTTTALAASLATLGVIALGTPSCDAIAQPVTKDRPAQSATPKPTATATKAPPTARPAASGRKIALADVAGRWAMRVMLMGGDSTLVLHDLIATPDRSGWRLIFPNRDPIPAQAVAVAGDSIVTVFGPYESVLRSGVQVTTRSVYRLRNGRLYGTTVAQYQTHSPDSVLQVRSVGTRMP